MPNDDTTPVFRFRPIYRMWVKTLEEVRTEDPWNGGRTCTFWIEDFRPTAATGCSLPALVSELDRVTRFMPESLCILYGDKEIPAAVLPGLLKGAEADLIRSDFLPVLKNIAFDASYLAFVGVSAIALLVMLFVLFEEDAPTWLGELILFGSFGVWWPCWHFGYQVKLRRRRQQKAHFRAAAERPGTQASVPHPGPTAAGLLSLDAIAARLAETAAREAIPLEDLPSYGRTRDFGYPHIEVDDAYHYVVVERGHERSRCSTIDFNELEYWVFEPIFSQICSRRAAAARTAGIDYRRAWFADQAEQLGRMNPDWRRRWEAKVQEILHHSPFSDLVSLDALAASMAEIIARLGITPDERDLPKYGRRSFDDQYVEIDDAYHLFYQERGVVHERLTTQSLSEIQYWIVRQILSDTGLRTQAEYRIAGVDRQRTWDERTAGLMRRIDPAWETRWRAEVQDRLARTPYRDAPGPA